MNHYKKLSTKEREELFRLSAQSVSIREAEIKNCR